jgi:hypothetical protein
MVTRGEQLAERIIQTDLECLSCGYNLRGLAGSVIQCPECGVECDVPRMIANRWTGRWQQAPGYFILIAPLASMLFGALGLLFLFVWEMARLEGSGLLTFMLAVLLLGVWVHMLGRARTLFGDDRGLTLALLVHGLFAMYVAGLILVVWGILRTSRHAEWALIAMNLLMALFGSALLVLARRGERWVAEQCIKRYVLKRSTPAQGN